MPSIHQISTNKIRKRGCSSSSSSSLVRRYRFKRAILVGKKGGSSTPVPLWKTSTTPPSMATPQFTKPLHSYGSGLPPKEKELSVSARKLAATLWEINDLHPSRVNKDFETHPIRGREKAANLTSRSGLLRPHMSDPSQSPLFERMKGFEGDGHKRRVSGLSQQLQSGDYFLEGLDACSSACLNEKNCGKCTVGAKNRLKEARTGLSTSKKLLKVLNQVCLREHQSSTKSLILALGSELDRVCHQIDQLIQEERSNQNDIEYVVKCFAEEKAAWKRREREKVHDALKNAAEELKVEKKLRKQTERLNKKIANEMANVKASHLKASKELEREKRAKEILQQICDELANGIGEDRAQVEELKRESAKVREEVEQEREMLQLADVLREERVQMKLSEAKYQFEEKNDVLEKLRNELECFMRTKDEENGDVSPECEKMKDLESYFSKIYGGLQSVGKESGLDVGDDDGDNDSDDGELHSIELNMDNSGCKWSYAFEEATHDDPKRVSIDSIGRKSLSERIQWGSICFNRGTSSSRKRESGVNDIQEGSDHLDPEISIKFLARTPIQDKDEAQSNRTIMGFQDSMSCSKPVQKNGQLLALQCTGEEAGKNALLALEGETN